MRLDLAAALVATTVLAIACQAAPCVTCPGAPDAANVVEGGLDASPPALDGAVFRCGTTFCDRSTEYCRHVQGGAPPGFDEMTCAPLPDSGGCDGILDCDCSEDAGAVYATCQVP